MNDTAWKGSKICLKSLIVRVQQIQFLKNISRFQTLEISSCALLNIFKAKIILLITIYHTESNMSYYVVWSNYKRRLCPNKSVNKTICCWWWFLPQGINWLWTHNQHQEWFQASALYCSPLKPFILFHLTCIMPTCLFILLWLVNTLQHPTLPSMLFTCLIPIRDEA